MKENSTTRRMMLPRGEQHSSNDIRSLAIDCETADSRENFSPLQEMAEDATDEQLISAAQAGVSSALEKLLQRNYAVVYAMARRFSDSKEDADDLVQETMLRAIKSIQSFRSEARFSSWLVAIVANTAISMKRRQRGIRWVYLNQGWPQSEEPATAVVLPDIRRNPEQEYMRNEARFMVQSAVARQHPNFRYVLRACCIEEMSVEDAACTLGISLPAAKSRLFRARKMLTRTLQKRLRRSK